MINNFKKNVVLNRYIFQLVYNNGSTEDRTVAAESEHSACLLVESDCEYRHEKCGDEIPRECILKQMETVEHYGKEEWDTVWTYNL